MRQTLSKGMAVAAAATGMLSLYGGSALADSHAQGIAQGSPGVLAGNDVQVAVDIPVNICGNSIDVAAALNPAFGNACANMAQHLKEQGDSRPHDGYGDFDASDDDTRPSPGGTHSAPAYGDEETTPPPHGDSETTPPAHGGESTPPAYGGKETTPPAHGGSETTAPAYGDEETTPAAYGDEETTPPGYGDEETTPPPYGGDETTAPPYGGEESTPPSGDHSTPPGDDHSTPPGDEYTPPPGGSEHQPPGPPPTLPHTGGEARALIGASAAGAAMIAAGTLLYRRNRAAARRS
ncbi:chaplin family protein [Streptomyces sp. NPDC017248]|uniref:chaplin n=1 Tax=unclassified Streptomyces TaxID=2593676 RepID=UPI00378EB5D4